MKKRVYIYGTIATIAGALVIKDYFKKEKEQNIMSNNETFKVPEFLSTGTAHYDADGNIQNPDNGAKKIITNRERESIIASIAGMSTEELAVILDNIPTPLIMDRLNRELERAKKFEEAIKAAIPQ